MNYVNLHYTNLRSPNKVSSPSTAANSTSLKRQSIIALSKIYEIASRRELFTVLPCSEGIIHFLIYFIFNEIHHNKRQLCEERFSLEQQPPSGVAIRPWTVVAPRLCEINGRNVAVFGDAELWSSRWKRSINALSVGRETVGNLYVQLIRFRASLRRWRRSSVNAIELFDMNGMCMQKILSARCRLSSESSRVVNAICYNDELTQITINQWTLYFDESSIKILSLCALAITLESN